MLDPNRLILADRSKTVTLRLARDLTRLVKRGNPWVFREALRTCPEAAPGTPAILLDNRRGRPVARGFYDPSCPIAFRAAEIDDPERCTDDVWAAQRMLAAATLRRRLFHADTTHPEPTTAFRLFNGEGDGLPGLVADVYETSAVLKLDGPGPSGFWNSRGVADWLQREFGLATILERPRERDADARVLIGSTDVRIVSFRENGLQFTADLRHGQKTGFFLDQRENRQLIRELARGQTLLNLFGYTGGFSVYAGGGGAQHVTTVDVAEPAIAVATDHWRRNRLPSESHTGVVADAFAFIDDANRVGRKWDLVISDPPSFAPSRTSLPSALAAYQKLAAGCAAITESEGVVALASCSSHVDLTQFLTATEEGIARARRRAHVLAITGQPADHPAPLALPEFRYLKFVVLRLN